MEKYVTLVILRYTFPLEEGGLADVELVNGGHVCPIVVRADGRVETIRDGDMPVGLLEYARFHAVRLSLAPGERLVLLSDGISEAEDTAGTMFGSTELARQILEADPVPALFRSLAQFCKGAPVQDDQTVLTIDRLS